MKLCIFVNPYSFTIFAVGGYKGGLPLNPLPQYNIVTKAEKLIFLQYLRIVVVSC